jgi:hypothetical protein
VDEVVDDLNAVDHSHGVAKSLLELGLQPLYALGLCRNKPKRERGARGCSRAVSFGGGVTELNWRRGKVAAGGTAR